MKISLLIITLFLTSFNQAQSPLSRLVRIDYGAGYIAVACHPDVDSALNPVNSFYQTFWNTNSWYITEGEFTNGGDSYNDRYMIMAYPLMTDSTEDIIVNGYIDKVLNFDINTPLYADEWIMQLQDNVDAYYRKGTTGAWINLDSIETELEADPGYLGPIYDEYTDTLNVYDNYVLCFQLKFVYQPEIDPVVVVDTIPCDSADIPTGYEGILFTAIGTTIAIGSFPGAGYDTTDVYDTPIFSLNMTNAYVAEYNPEVDTNYNYVYSPDRLYSMTVPAGEYGTEDQSYIANIFVKNQDWNDAVEYLRDWDFEDAGNNDYYYRKSISDPWIYLNEITDTLAVDSAYLGNFYHYGDSTDYSQDGFVLAAQIKIVVPPVCFTLDTVIVIDPVDTTANAVREFIQPKILIKTTTDAFEFVAPNDNYTLSIYDMAGKVLFTDRFYGETYRFRTAELKPGMYIYRLESSTETYTGKLYKP